MSTTIPNKYAILNQLDWDLFVDLANKHALFPDTARSIFDQELAPNKIEKIYDLIEHFLRETSYEEVNDARHALANISSDFIGSQSGLKLVKGGVLELEELAEMITLMESILGHLSLFRFCVFQEPLESDIKFEREFKKNVLREFRSFVSADGEIDFFKHPKLKELYRQQLETEGAIRSTLSGLRNEENYQNALQFSGHDVLNDKYVLPIKSDRFSSSLGNIVARSESGRTLYVEPLKVRELNRKRFEIVLKIDAIIHQIARDFCQRLAPWGNKIDEYAELARVFDDIWTRSRFCQELSLTRPKLLSEPSFKLEGFFHPLIDGPIKNNMRLSFDKRGVLISGPNTGGKTASIKAVALCCMFAKCGLYAPARSAALHLFEKVFYFGNDRQSLPEGLSSFAAEAKSYAELVGNLGQTNLVVIDEVFSSTSSEEASALAISLFNKLTESGETKVLVSTHHQTLKTMAHSSDEYISCHVGFDLEKNTPTYKLIYGFPGKSMALEVFRELMAQDPFCQDVYKEASKKLDNKMINYEKLLSELSLKEQKLAQLEKESEQTLKELKNQKESAKGVAKLKVQEEVDKAKKELEKIARMARSAYEKAKKGDYESKKRLEKDLRRAQESVVPLARVQDDFKQREAKVQMPRPKSLEAGERYFCSFVNQTVTLKELKKSGQAVVSKGAMNIKVPASSLFASNTQGKHQKVVVTATRDNVSKIEYDCRGMRLSEFQSLVEGSVPDVLSGDVPFINFIHGHGNGTLKDWLRNYIKNTASIDWDRGDSGNDGETRVIASQ